MNPPEKLNRMFRIVKLTRTRIAFALGVAVIADGVQFFLGPVGWVVIDQVIDVMAFALTAWLLGFHLLLLPTFIVEFFPVADILPTWTACVLAVIVLRKREQNAAPPPQLKDRRE